MGPSSAGSWERWALECHLMSFLLLLLLFLLAAHFLHQQKCNCHFFNGTQQVRFLFRYIYDRQETARFDSNVGKFVAVTEFGQGDVDQWNRRQDLLQYERAAMDHFCREAYRVASYRADKTRRVIGRSTKPTVTVSPAQTDPGSPNTILLCTATGFYPLEIDVQWLKNGRREKEGVAFGEELQNGDWT
ncbi:HLA class II histocompatibility antigen, DRB1-4 beta chain-like [Python bivittatus]|uniref:HLA class II histocompatibility antigen, DRB1-4 beta chain-like n=1 Tax=Python bivittatus TaxID=176946 RepID=A0A9F5N0P8_PYTBI|nr:HLA class II histocompatibility antigen, DRB1-4 beta chain-like [Python bivittatus]